MTVELYVDDEFQIYSYPDEDVVCLTGRIGILRPNMNTDDGTMTVLLPVDVVAKLCARFLHKQLAAQYRMVAADTLSAFIFTLEGSAKQVLKTFSKKIGRPTMLEEMASEIEKRMREKK